MLNSPVDYFHYYEVGWIGLVAVVASFDGLLDNGDNNDPHIFDRVGMFFGISCILF